MKKLFSLLTITALSLPSTALAHVKWFAEEEELHNQPTASLFESETTGVIVWAIVIVLAVVLAFFLEKKLEPFKWIVQKEKNWHGIIVRIFRSIVALWLIYNTVAGNVLAPNFMEGSALFETLLWMQFVAGLLLLGNKLTTWIGSGILALVYVGIIVQFGIVEALDHVEVLGMAAFMAIMEIPKEHKWSAAIPWGLPIMRVLTGITLIVLAFSEKLLQPEMALSFLAEHNWNFMQMIGLSWFSDELFILSAGMAEMLFGILFILGLITRINTIALAVFFIATAVVLGPIEIVGHLPFFGMVLVYVFMGSGEKLTTTALLARR